MLAAVFVPCAFITGITGRFFRQFALDRTVSTVISAFNSLALSPALHSAVLRQQDKSTARRCLASAYPLVGFWLGYEFLGSLLSSVLPANFCLAISQWVWQDFLGVLSSRSLPYNPFWVPGAVGAAVGIVVGWFVSRPLNYSWVWRSGRSTAGSTG